MRANVGPPGTSNAQPKSRRHRVISTLAEGRGDNHSVPILSHAEGPGDKVGLIQAFTFVAQRLHKLKHHPPNGQLFSAILERFDRLCFCQFFTVSCLRELTIHSQKKRATRGTYNLEEVLDILDRDFDPLRTVRALTQTGKIQKTFCCLN